MIIAGPAHVAVLAGTAVDGIGQDRAGRRLQQPFDEPRRQHAGRQRPLARLLQGSGAVPAGQANDAASRPHPLSDVLAAVDQAVDVACRGHADRRRLGAQALGRALHDGARFCQVSGQAVQ